MERIRTRILIQAPAPVVYQKLLQPEPYQEWTAIFNPNSRYEGNWEAGSKMYFLGEDKDGNTVGMISEVVENIPNQYVCLKHLGFLDKGKEVVSGEAVKDIAGATESYRLIEKGDETEVEVEMDTHPDYKEYMLEKWPQALNRLKKLAEQWV